jgi:hypothetical protein
MLTLKLTPEEQAVIYESLRGIIEAPIPRTLRGSEILHAALRQLDTPEMRKYRAEVVAQRQAQAAAAQVQK